MILILRGVASLVSGVKGDHRLPADPAVYLFFQEILVFYCLCMDAHAMVHMWRPKDKPGKLAFSFCLDMASTD